MPHRGIFFQCSECRGQTPTPRRFAPPLLDMRGINLQRVARHWRVCAYPRICSNIFSHTRIHCERSVAIPALLQRPPRPAATPPQEGNLPLFLRIKLLNTVTPAKAGAHCGRQRIRIKKLKTFVIPAAAGIQENITLLLWNFWNGD